jgi:HK97 family phage major capsid protein
MSAVTLNELDIQLTQKRQELKTKWESYEKKTLADGSTAPVIPANDLPELNQRNDEINELASKADVIRGAMANMQEPEAKAFDNRPVNRPGFGMTERKSIAEMVRESDEFKSRQRGAFSEVDLTQGMSMKSVMTTGTGYIVENTRDGDFVPYLNNAQPNVINLVPTQQTSNETITYVRQTARTSGAAAKKEGQALGQSDFVVSTVTDPLRYVGTYMDATLAQIEDVEQFNALMNQELPAMVLEELERLYLVGAGTGNEFYGVYNDTNAQTQALATDTYLDAFRKAIGKVEDYSADQRPNLIVMRPFAWRSIELMKTADGNYIFSNPANITTPRLWGYRVATSQLLGTGTALVMDSKFFPLVYRDGMRVDSTNADGEKFQNLIVTVRAFVRAGVKHRRGQAACKVTGLTES